MIRNNQNRRRRGGNNNGPRPQQMGAGNNYGNRLDNRQRGNASQLLEKYRALARDAQQAGDRVTAEYYLQYADHYYRVLGDYREKMPNDGRQRGREFYDDDATGYAANGDDADNGDDDDQDGDRNEVRNDDEGRSQWRDERGNGGNRNNARDGGRENGQREPRGDGNRGDGNRAEGNRNDGNRNDGNRNENRDRQGWNGNGRVRDDQRPERARDEQRAERSRDDRQRDDRPREDRQREDRPREDQPRGENIRRERRPEAQRTAPIEAAISDEGPIPGLPGPATLRARRPFADDAAPERAPRAERVPRRDIAAVAVVEAPVEMPVVAIEAGEETAAPRRRGRPRKVVDAAPVEG